MAYLKMDGVTVPVAVDSVSMRYVNVGGEKERSPGGSLEGGPLRTKREWAMATIPVLASELDAWVCLIEGRGHVWPFDAGYYSTRGRGPFSTVGASIITSGMKHGGGHLSLGTGVFLAYNPNLPLLTWTVLYWRKESGVWKHYIQRGDGAKWLGGVRNDALNPQAIQVDAPAMALGDLGSAGLGLFDDVVTLPYSVPDAWIPLFYAQHSAGAWSALPRVTAEGGFAAAAVTVRGEVTDIRTIRYAPAGTPVAGQTLQFTLREV